MTTYTMFEAKQDGSGKDALWSFTPPSSWDGDKALVGRWRSWLKYHRFRGKTVDLTKNPKLLPQAFRGQRLWIEVTTGKHLGSQHAEQQRHGWRYGGGTAGARASGQRE